MSLLAAKIVGHEGLFMTFDDDSSDTMESDSTKLTSRDTHCCSKQVFRCTFNPLETPNIIRLMSQQNAPSPPPVPPESFDTKRLAIQWALDTNVKHHKQAKTKRSDPERIHLACTDPQCAFSFCARKNAEGVFRVVRWSWHSCDPFGVSKTKRSWVKDQALELLRGDEIVNAAVLQRKLRSEMGVEVKITAARKALSSAHVQKEHEDASFDKLPGLLRELAERNPGTVADFTVNGDGRFAMAFVCPGPCARAWAHCPRMVALDAAHGTSSYKGVVMVATAIDGAGQIFPVAFGVAPSETVDSWRFFVSHLAHALNVRDVQLTVISDRCRGIDTAVAEFMPRALHSLCAFHISQNVAQRYGRQAASHVWRVANASTPGEYDSALAALAQVSLGAAHYLEDIPREHWVRAFFALPRFGHVTSNVAESVNAWLLEQRSQPPLRFFLDTIQKINALFHERWLKYEKLNPNDIEPETFASIVRNTEDGRRLECVNVFGMKFQVQSRVAGGALRDVDLERRECSCKQF